MAKSKIEVKKSYIQEKRMKEAIEMQDNTKCIEKLLINAINLNKKEIKI
jgi:hypothetical protein